MVGGAEGRSQESRQFSVSLVELRCHQLSGSRLTTSGAGQGAAGPLVKKGEEGQKGVPRARHLMSVCSFICLKLSSPGSRYYNGTRVVCAELGPS